MKPSKKHMIFALLTLTVPTTLFLLFSGVVGARQASEARSLASNISKTWYFAEGYTGGSFTEYLTVANPNPSATTVTVKYLLQGASPITKSYSVKANSRFTLNVNGEIGKNRNVSMVLTGSQPIIAERPMYFTYTGLPGYSIPGGSDVLGATSLDTTFDFGYLDTTKGHDTYLTILNQNSSTMRVTVQYYEAKGGSPIIKNHNVAANSRGTVHVNSEGLPAGTYSAVVQLSEPGLVERPMYLKDSSTGYTGAADVVGVPQMQENWYFAEGYASSTFQERYIVSNPSPSVSADVVITFFLSSGGTKTTSFSLAPGQQRLFSVGSLLSGNNSAIVHATGPVLAERFMSFKYLNQIPGATDALGTVAPSTQFYFAEGYTGSQFSEYLTIENPNNGIATVQVTFLPATGGAPKVQPYSIAARSRFTLNTGSVMPRQSFSMIVTSNVPIVAERPMYFIYTGNQTGGSDVVGYQPAGTVPSSVPPTVFVGSEDNYMYALNPATGALIWRFQTPGGTDSNAIFANGIVYFGSSDGNFYALNANTGEKVWSFPVGTAGLDGMSYPASAVVNGVVYITSTNGNAYALNANDGSVVWSKALPDFLAPIMAAPLVANGAVYVLVDARNITALSASDGSVLWSSNNGDIFAATPAFANGLVYFIDGVGVVHAFDANGNEAWHSASLGGSSGASDSVVAENGVVYVLDVQSINLYAFDGTTGAVLWSKFAAPSLGDIFTSHGLAVANGIIYVGDIDGNLYTFSASNGNSLWHYQTGGSVDAIPVVANGVVYFGSTDTFVYALDASKGTFDWRFQTGGNVSDTPTVSP